MNDDLVVAHDEGKHDGRPHPLCPVCMAESRDTELNRLVERASVSLADLYRKGKKRGLLTSRSAYN